MRACTCLVLVVVLMFAFSASTAGEKKTKPLKVCLVSGSFEYDSGTSLALLQKHLEKHYNVECSRAFTKVFDDLPGLENLDGCDVMLLYTRRLTIGGDQLERIKKYIQAGKPLVGLRTTSHAFQKWLELDKNVLGGNYKGHYNTGPITEVEFTAKGKGHPILEGVKPFKSVASLYKNTGHASDIEVLARGTIPDHSEPLAWTRDYKGGRVFYTSLGHLKDFDDDNFVRMVVNGLYWAAKRTPEKR